MSGAAAEHKRIVADLAARLADVDALDPGVREVVYGVLDAVDELHGRALRRVGESLDAATLARLRAADPGIAWLFDAYAVGINHDALAAALEPIRADAHASGADLELAAIRDGVVRLLLLGSGGDADRLRALAERALEPHVPGFIGVEITTDPSAPALPEGARLLPLVRQHR